MVPQHIFITQEKIYKDRVFYRGLTSEKTGTIILSADADVTTVPHELVHSVFGVGELLASRAGNILAFKYLLTKRFKRLMLKPLRVEYQEVEVPPQYKGRIRHYIRV